MAAAGPLGVLTGMSWDADRNRYFPTPPAASSDLVNSPSEGRSPLPRRRGILKENGGAIGLPGSSRSGGKSGNARICEATRGKKVKFNGPLPVGQGAADEDVRIRPRTGQMVHSRRVRSDRVAERTSFHSSMQLEPIRVAADCNGESVTSITTVMGGYFATTDHGNLMGNSGDGMRMKFGVCGAGIMAMYNTFNHKTIVTISSGAEPHLHRWRLDSDPHTGVEPNDSLDINTTVDIFSVSDYRGHGVLGGNGSLTIVRPNFTVSRRALPSDPLALHYFDRHLVLAGLRSGKVLLEDLRVRPEHHDSIASTRKGKAVVGVKRLKDSSVPWGMVVSGMSHEMLVFDIRFGREPLHTLAGHRNNYMPGLALDTTSDDKFIYAASSDNRIRAWHLRTGRNLFPDDGDEPFPVSGRIGPVELNPLRRIFPHPIVAMSAGDEDGVLHVGCHGTVHTYSKLPWRGRHAQ